MAEGAVAEATRESSTAAALVLEEAALAGGDALEDAGFGGVAGGRRLPEFTGRRQGRRAWRRLGHGATGESCLLSICFWRPRWSRFCFCERPNSFF